MCKTQRALPPPQKIILTALFTAFYGSAGILLAPTEEGPASKRASVPKNLPISQIHLPSPNINENILAPHLNRITSHSRRRILHRFPVRHVKLPPVPWARHDLPLQRPLSQRPAPVQTRIADGVNLPTHIRHRHRLPLHQQLRNVPHRQFPHLPRSHIRHRPLLSSLASANSPRPQRLCVIFLFL